MNNDALTTLQKQYDQLLIERRALGIQCQEREDEAQRQFGLLADAERKARKELDKWKRRAKLFQEGYKDSSFEACALRIQKMQLEAYGADKVLPMQNASLRKKLVETFQVRNIYRAALKTIAAKGYDTWAFSEVRGIAKQALDDALNLRPEIKLLKTK